MCMFLSYYINKAVSQVEFVNEIRVQIPVDNEQSVTCFRMKTKGRQPVRYACMSRY